MSHEIKSTVYDLWYAYHSLIIRKGEKQVMKVEVRDLEELGQELYINEQVKDCTGVGYNPITCVEIVKYMRMAYEAGKNGEAFDYTILNEGL